MQQNTGQAGSDNIFDFHFGWLLLLLSLLNTGQWPTSTQNKKAVLSQGVPRDAAVNFGTYRSFQWHRVVFTAAAMLSN